MNALVSIIIPTYKRPDTVHRAVDSVLRQTYEDLEVIVVDDNDPGTEARTLTEASMTKYVEDARVHYVKHPRNMNGSAARNTGVRESHGVYIAFLDDDDEFYPQKIESQVKCMGSRDHSWGACYADYVQLDINGKIVMRNGEHREGNLFLEVLKRNLFIHAGSNMMVRRTVFEELNGFDESFLRNQDIEFMVRLLRKYKLAYVRAPGVIVHMHKKESAIAISELTAQYKQKFNHYIHALNQKDMTDVDTYLNLQIIRSMLLTRHNCVEAFKMIKKENVSIYITARYFAYLLIRRIRKKSYGFKL